MGSAPHLVTWSAPAPLLCVSCHDIAALPARHARVFPHNPPTRDDCLACHDVSAHTTGAVIVVGHNAAWRDPLSPSFHAYSANIGLDSCKGCHGDDLAGGPANVACSLCHDANLPIGVTTWKQNCVMCHGGTDNATGAPPRTTWGKSSELVRVGAHSVHLQGSALAGPIACGTCHVVPADALTPGHIDGQRASVTLSGLAALGTRPTYDPATGTCSATYCHGGGAPLTDGTNTRPVWTTLDGSQAACGTCHGIPPRSAFGHGYPPPHNDNACTFCHYDVADDRGTRITNPAAHVNGVVDVRNRDVDPDCASCHGW
jgi:predicted CxxxxCH...CXXCH cytochrome family protein